MNELFSDSTIWLRTGLNLGWGMTLICGVAVVVARYARTPRWRRQVWQTAIVAALVLLTVETTGLSQWIVRAAWSPADTDNVAVNDTQQPVADDSVTIGDTHVRTIGVGNQPAIPDENVLAALDRHLSTDPSWHDPVSQSSATTVSAPIETRPVATIPVTASRPKSATVEPNTTHVPSAAPSTGSGVPFWERWWGPIWFGVAFVLTFKAGVRRWRLRLLKKTLRDKHSDALQQTVNSVMTTLQNAGLSVSPRMRFVESESIRGPLTFGIWRPVVLLPRDFEERFTPAQQRAILLHELSHVALRDAFWQFVIDGASILLWWHPALRWIRRAFRDSCESAADDAARLAPDGPQSLAESLVALYRDRVDRSAYGWIGMTGGHRSVTDRVESLLTMTPETARNERPMRRFVLRLLLLFLMSIALPFGSASLFASQLSVEQETDMQPLWKRSLLGLTVAAAISPFAVNFVSGDDDAPERERPAAREGERRERERRRDGDRPQDRLPPRRGERESSPLRRPGPERPPEADRHIRALHEAARRAQEQLRRVKGDGEEAQAQRERLRDELEHIERTLHAHRGGPRPGREERPDAEVREIHERMERIHAELREIGDRDGREADEARERLHGELRDLQAALERHGGEHRPGPEGERERRMHHLRVAIENLHAGGFHEPAEALERQLRAVNQDVLPPRRDESALPGNPNRPLLRKDSDFRVPGPRREPHPEREVNELREQVRELRGELSDIRQLLKKALEDDDD